MAEATITSVPVPDEQFLEETLSERFMDWVRTELIWYAGSFTIHLFALSLLLLLGPVISQTSQGDAPAFETKNVDEAEKKEPEKFDNFEMGAIDETPPPELDVSPTLETPRQEAQTEEYNNDSDTFEKKGGGTPDGQKDFVSGGAGAISFGPGPKVSGDGGLGSGFGTGTLSGSGGSGSGLGFRGQGHRKAMLASGGGTKNTERAVTAALIWLANHQNSDGSWSLEHFNVNCKPGDKSCTGAGNEAADTGATAMGLLPYLAAGQTHKSKGPYKDHITRAVGWLLRNQQADGCLAAPIGNQMMYSHGLATIALSEAYGLSGDKQVGQAAQRAVDFIIKAQNQRTGGWRYHPGENGDTSVVGWQLMALKSAHMAGLTFSDDVFHQTSKWLDSVSVRDGTEYCYVPGEHSKDTMTAVGLLCRQYLGANRDNPMLTGGMDFLMKNLPDENQKNVYYWYYATQVMHNMNNYEWDTWNRKMRTLLVNTQCRDNNCAKGSWDPANDAWSHYGGRVMQTALSTLTLEIYYRYLPLFKAEAAGDGGNAKAVKKADKGV